MASALKILVVDDEAELRNLLERSFAREGHEVVAVRRRRAGARARARPTTASTSCCSTSRSGRGRRATTSRASCAPGATSSRSSCSPRSTARPTRCRASRRAPTTTSPSRSASPSCAAASARCCAAPAAACSTTANVATFGPVTLDRRRRAVTVRGEPVKLTFSEFELLSCLLSAPGRLFNRQELLRAIWGDSAYRDPRAIDVHIRHLREKLEESPEEPRLILTVRGAGYRLPGRLRPCHAPAVRPPPPPPRRAGLHERGRRSWSRRSRCSARCRTGCARRAPTASSAACARRAAGRRGATLSRARLRRGSYALSRRTDSRVDRLRPRPAGGLRHRDRRRARAARRLLACSTADARAGRSPPTSVAGHDVPARPRAAAASASSRRASR